MENGCKILNKILLAVRQRENGGNLGNVISKILPCVLLKKLVHLEIISFAPLLLCKLKTPTLQFVWESVEQWFIDKLVSPVTYPARLVLRFIKCVTIQGEKGNVKIIWKLLSPPVWQSEQNGVNRTQVLASIAESYNEFEAKLLILLCDPTKGEEKSNLIKIQPVKFSRVSATLMALHNFGLNPKLSKMLQFSLIFGDLVSKVRVRYGKQLCYVSGVRQKVRALIGNRDYLVHEGILTNSGQIAIIYG